MAPRPGPPSRRADLLLLGAILLLAAALRLPGLEARGQWDADQGSQMLAVLALVRDGDLPLVGPPTFAGTFHHGAWWYYLLAPAALLTDADPAAVTLELALLGLAAVAATWFLGRAVGGRWTGHLAGLLAAVSPSLVLASTFIWNPNPLPLASALALLGAIRAWRSRDPRWWLLAAAGAAAAMQLHVSGVLLAVPLAAAFVLDAGRARGGDGAAWPRHAAVGVAAVALLGAGYLPLLAHELATGFADARGLAGYLGGGAAAGSDTSLAARVATVALRSLSWPLAGSIAEAPGAAVLLGLAVPAGWLLAYRTGGRDARGALLLLAGVAAWAIPVLAVVAPGLATVVPGLPTDHYHAFLDPVVLVAAASGVAAVGGLLGPSARPIRLAPARRALAGALAVGLVTVAVRQLPPAPAPDGGWPLADRAAERVAVLAGERAVRLHAIPAFKTADALRFPLERRRTRLAQAEPATGDGPALDVLVCDPLFEPVVGLPCGGPAEAAWAAARGDGSRALVERFSAGSRRVVSVYEAAGR